MACLAKANNVEIHEKGRASIEWYKEGKPQYYCYGYKDRRTDELLDECQICRKNVRYAQEDLDEYIKKNRLYLR